MSTCVGGSEEYRHKGSSAEGLLFLLRKVGNAFILGNIRDFDQAYIKTAQLKKDL